MANVLKLKATYRNLKKLEEIEKSKNIVNNVTLIKKNVLTAHHK